MLQSKNRQIYQWLMLVNDITASMAKTTMCLSAIYKRI